MTPIRLLLEAEDHLSEAAAFLDERVEGLGVDLTVASRAGKAMVDDRVTTDQQILNAMGPKQSQELFEVVR